MKFSFLSFQFISKGFIIRINKLKVITAYLLSCKPKYASYCKILLKIEGDMFSVLVILKNKTENAAYEDKRG